MSNSNNLFISVKDFIAEEVARRAELLGVNGRDAKIDGDQSLLDSGFFDSMSFLELLGNLEDKFNTEIDLSDYDPEEFLTPDGLAGVVAAGNSNVSDEPQTEDPAAEKTRLQFEEIAPGHKNWDDVGKLFHSMYEDFESKGLMIPLVENGEQIWLKSTKNTVGKTTLIVGCLDEARLVGFVVGTIKILPAFLKGKTAGFINGIYVQPEYRGKGIAVKLYQAVEDWFTKSRVESIELQVLTGNESAILFWEKNGFKSELLQMRKTK